ncbi:MAG TPA: alpha-glucosidase/alpha-galactosidase [Candidatus Aphodoplasma excrementigallinarum]|uniref:Alpha-glucosidase/alpha-galactosidase n=1 Tax=Candidatus Aphodoplasma excrementigallinarum TaxID=2840673 RepID=A0A9D1NHN7_9FIRM|nr:alpha-glucosidase/alpha-galactosidase [Candidatus Aphodoplasma excrementigallinarum]
MNTQTKTEKTIKIAYIGGGSRGWAWKLMDDLSKADDLYGEVSLYDIDFAAALANETIGALSGGNFTYHAYESPKEALTDADFVIISITPGTFDEMESDVHTPEKYGIYQSVGDTVGPGGILRALRTIPMYETIAGYIRDYCPQAWVINYTNPMSVCVKTLYEVFPQIKAFGCCHEVFGTQELFADALCELRGIENAQRRDILVNVTGINHFTWITQASYFDIDLIDLYKEYIAKHPNGVGKHEPEDYFGCTNRVKFDLFTRFGAVAASGDRHLAEFCPGNWYLKDPQTVLRWGFSLTPVSWRKKDLAARLQKSADLQSGAAAFEHGDTGEEGVNQIRALLGLDAFVTNVNVPNVGQIPNLPLGAVVETNALFSKDGVRPLMAGDVPGGVLSLMLTTAINQLTTVQAGLTRDLDLAFRAFCTDRLCDRLSPAEAQALFDEMLANTKDYLPGYGL